MVRNPGSGRVLVCTLHPDRQKHDGEVKSDDPFVKAIPTDKRLPVMLLQVNNVTCVCLVAFFFTFGVLHHHEKNLPTIWGSLLFLWMFLKLEKLSNFQLTRKPKKKLPGYEKDFEDSWKVGSVPIVAYADSHLE